MARAELGAAKAELLDAASACSLIFNEYIAAKRLFPSLADAGDVYVRGIGHWSSNDVERGRSANLVMEGIEELALEVVSGFIVVC